MNENEIRQTFIELYPEKTSEEIDQLVNYIKNEEGAWKILRDERNKLLIESDWTQISDFNIEITQEKKDLWAIYRQELRDLPQNTVFPGYPKYPEKPI
jgi:hypothetical protein